ncbi:hypothetical protein C4J81_05220 [Deltaproteobacteria bacterium Smac51]|nr:hypothetical protein C4J81_05220 [Deltaproteobacteria bacterium Smac51]
MASILVNDQFCQGPCPKYGLGFRTGEVVNFYSHSLYWLVKHTGLGNVVAEFLKDGEPIIYGELTYDELERLAAKGLLINLRRHSWGVSWSFNEQPRGAEDDFSGFMSWREGMLTESCEIQPRLQSSIDSCFYLS